MSAGKDYNICNVFRSLKRLTFNFNLEINSVSEGDHVYNTITNDLVNNTLENEDGDPSHDYYSFSVVQIPKTAIRVSDLSEKVLVGDMSTLKLQFEVGNSFKLVNKTYIQNV